jgi:hypothetical protein
MAVSIASKVASWVGFNLFINLFGHGGSGDGSKGNQGCYQREN